jgi:hypothetical protein
MVCALRPAGTAVGSSQLTVDDHTRSAGQEAERAQLAAPVLPRSHLPGRVAAEGAGRNDMVGITNDVAPGSLATAAAMRGIRSA